MSPESIGVEPRPANRATAAPFRLGYRPSLDGLRGVSILAVALNHAHLAPERYGEVGVDIFFALSGFLITALLAEEYRETGTIRFKKFYSRRALRLLPALVAMLIVVTSYCWMVISREYGVRNAWDALISLFYSSNWVHIFDIQRPGLFGHTWTISIEEQFYILWPFMLYFLLRRASSPGSMLCWIALGIFLSEMLRIFLTATGGDYLRMYCGTDTRADSLLLGAALSVLLIWGLLPQAAWLKRLSGFLALCSVAGLIGVCFFSNVFVFGFDICVVWLAISVFAALIIGNLILSERGWLTRVLSLPPLVYLGRISYGFYIWHHPIFILVHSHGWRLARELAVELPLSIALTLASFYLLERPFLRLKSKFSAVIPAKA